MNVKKIVIGGVESNIGVDWANVDNKQLATTSQDGLLDKEDKKLLDQYRNEINTDLQIIVNDPIIYEKGSIQTVTISWTIKSNNEEIVPDLLYINNQQITSTLKEQQYTSVSNDTTYTIKAVKNSVIKENSTMVKFVYPIYLGKISKDFTPNEEEIKALSSNLTDTNSIEQNFSLNDEKICMAHASILGENINITDGYLNYTNSYSKSNLSINDVDYTIYLLSDEVTVNNINQKFVIS